MKTFFDNAGELADKITPCETLEALIETIEKPRTIILMVPAGTAVDEQIATLRPLLDADDMIVDAGNANFNDTNRRASEAAAAGVPFLGIVSLAAKRVRATDLRSWGAVPKSRGTALRIF